MSARSAAAGGCICSATFLWDIWGALTVRPHLHGSCGANSICILPPQILMSYLALAVAAGCSTLTCLSDCPQATPAHAALAKCDCACRGTEVKLACDNPSISVVLASLVMSASAAPSAPCHASKMGLGMLDFCSLQLSAGHQVLLMPCNLQVHALLDLAQLCKYSLLHMVLYSTRPVKNHHC